jgi:hypothetical protein
MCLLKFVDIHQQTTSCFTQLCCVSCQTKASWRSLWLAANVLKLLPSRFASHCNQRLHLWQDASQFCSFAQAQVQAQIVSQ